MFAYSYVCICETFLNNTYSDGELYIRDYVTFRKDRYSHGGGLLFCVKSHLNC